VRAPVLLLLVATAGSLQAQLDPRVKVGAQVRVRTAQPDPLLAIGRVVSVDWDTLVVERNAADPALRVPLRDIGELAIQARGKTAQVSGMVVGTVGALAGGALYVNWCLRNLDFCRELERDDDPDDDEEEDEESMSPFGAVVLAFGLIGYGIGYSLAPPTWTIVHLPIRMGIAPMQRGVGVYVSLPAPRFVRDSR
jgi:hypothetical protein